MVVWIPLVCRLSILAFRFCLLLSMLSFNVSRVCVFCPLCPCAGQALFGYINIVSPTIFLLKYMLSHGHE